MGLSIRELEQRRNNFLEEIASYKQDEFDKAKRAFVNFSGEAVELVEMRLQQGRERTRRFRESHPQYKKLPLSQRLQMLRDQDNKCPICRAEFSEFNPSHLDHNHKTRESRELLCRRCNFALGWIDDSITSAQRMVQYLEKHTAPQDDVATI